MLEDAIKLKFAPFCSPCGYLFLLKSKFSVSGRKPCTIVRDFCPKLRSFFEVFLSRHQSAET